MGGGSTEWCAAALPSCIQLLVPCHVVLFNIIVSVILDGCTQPLCTACWPAMLSASSNLNCLHPVLLHITPIADNISAPICCPSHTIAGKSSLINAMKRIGGTSGKREPTVAPIPGTTLGLLRVPGIPLGPKHRTFDTPGVPHPYQLTSMLPASEVGLVLPRKRLKPRTFRIGSGNSILLGGLLRLDVVAIPGSSVYVTAYVSDELTSHMGKTEGAEERRAKHVGGLLVPPCSPERLEEMGELVAREVSVEGDSWTQHSKDVAVAGAAGVG